MSFPDCSTPIDVAIVLDLSSGMFDGIYAVNIQLARALVAGLPLGSSLTGGVTVAQVALVTVSDGSSVQFYLNTYKDETDAFNAMSFQLLVGQPDMAGALRLLYQSVFTPARGDRAGVKNYAVVITDADTPDNYSEITREAANARLTANVEIYSASVGDGPYIEEMAAVADDANHVLTLSGPADVMPTATNLLKKLCMNTLRRRRRRSKKNF